MNKYIVINSEDIQKRIKELEKSDEFFSQGSFGEHKILKQILSNSKQLKRIIEDAFEAGEKRYFSENLSRQSLNIVGAKESLLNMSEDMEALKKYESEFSLLENKYDTETLLSLADKTLSNISR